MQSQLGEMLRGKTAGNERRKRLAEMRRKEYAVNSHSVLIGEKHMKVILINGGLHWRRSRGNWTHVAWKAS